MLLLPLILAATPVLFPIPKEKASQPVAPTETRFHVPRSLTQAERFYREQFQGNAAIVFLHGHDEAGETLTIRNSSKEGLWTKAVLHGDDTSTTIQLTQVMVLAPTTVQGSAPQPVFVFVPRSGEVKQQLDAIGSDHEPAH